MYTKRGQADWPDFCQGARCGHIEGKGRAGAYVIGEEEETSYQAAEANVADEPNRYYIAWAKGYSYGYQLAAEGSGLPTEVSNAPLPKGKAPCAVCGGFGPHTPGPGLHDYVPKTL